MADVGVLTLQIHSDAEQAVESLRRLEGALNNIKTAVSGSQISRTASALAKINQEISIHTVTNLNGVASALKQIKEASDFTVPDLSGLNRVMKAMEAIKRGKGSAAGMREAFDGVAEGVRTVAYGVEKANRQVNEFNGSLRETMQLMQNTGWTNTFQQFSTMLDSMMRMKSSNLLGAGNPMFRLTGGGVAPGNMLSTWVDRSGTWQPNWTTGAGWQPDWVSAPYRDTGGAIPAEGWVSGDMADAADRFAEALGNVDNALEHVAERTEEASRGMHDFNDSLRDTMQIMQSTGWTNSFQQFSDMLDAMMRMRSSNLLGSGSSPLLLGSGGVAPENMMSTWVDPNAPWQPNWTSGAEWKPDWVSTPSRDTGGAIPVEGWVSGDAQEAVENANNFADAMENVRSSAGNANDYNPAIEFAREWNNSTARGTGGGMAESIQEDIAWVNNLIESASEIDLLNMRIDSMTDRLVEGVTTGNMTGEQIASLVSKIQDARDRVEDLTRAAEEQETVAYRLGSAWGAFKDGIQRMFPTITGLIKRFAQIAKYRLLRSVMKHIASGFSEGVENMYHYSKAIGSDLAPAMDQAATALQQMKNSIGAAMAPVIQALVPVLQTVVNAFINLINYANQFFALLRGQNTWTRALPEAAEAYEKNSKAAKKASKATKDLLADWDELNIIQSQNNGGGSTGSGKTAEEYKNMFEEVSDFDQKVKDALSFIDEYLGGLSGLLKKLGAIILGWKLSKAFTGALSAIGKLVAGGALVVLGVELSYGAGFSAGSKGQWDTGDILKAIVGGLAAAIGGALITTALGLGGVVGFGIGLTVAAVATLIGWIKGQQDLADRNKWGNLKMTQEQIEKFVKDQFSFDVDAEIDIMKAHISDIEGAKENVRKTVSAFSDSLGEAERVVAEVDTTTAQEKVAAVTKAAQDAQEAIKAVQALIDANEKGLTYTLTNFQFTDAEGKDISADLLNSIKVSDATLRNYFTDIGTQLANLILEGEKSGWKNGEMEAALELMASQKRIFDRAEELQGRIEYETQASAAIKKVVDRDTAQKIMQEQTERFAAYKETVKEVVQKEADTLANLAAMAESAAIEAGYDPLTGTGPEEAMKLHQASLDYQTALEAIVGDLEGAVEKRLAETKKKMAEEWASVLNVVYGADYEGEIDRVVDKGASLFDIPAEDYLLDPFGTGYTLGGGWKEHGYEETAEALKKKLISNLGLGDLSGVTKHYFEELEGDLWTFLSKDFRRKIAEKLQSITGTANDAYQIFKLMFGLTPEEAKEYIDPMYHDIWADVNNPREFKVSVSGAQAEIANAEEIQNGVKPISEPVKVAVNAQPEVRNVEEFKEKIIEEAEGAVDEIKATVEEFGDGTIHITPNVALSDGASTVIRYVENAINSGKGKEELKEAINQAVEDRGYDAYIEALPYVNMLTEKYRERSGQEKSRNLLETDKGQPKVVNVKKLNEEVREYKEPITVPVEIHAEPDSLAELKEKITEAMSDGIMDTEESFALMMKYGIGEYDQAMKELQYNLDEEGRNLGKYQKPMAMLASASGLRMTGGRGVLDTSPGETGPIKTAPADNTQEVNNVEAGVKKGNENVVSTLDAILSVLRAIGVNVSNQSRNRYVPTSAAGAYNAASTVLLQKVTGDHP